MVCAECMKMCCLGGKNSVVKGLTDPIIGASLHVNKTYIPGCDYYVSELEDLFKHRTQNHRLTE